MPLLYYPTSPEPTEKLSETQPKMLQNFTSIQTLLQENHGTFGTSEQGMHKYVILNNSAVPTTPAENSTDLTLFARTNSGANFPQLWLQYPNADVVQLTGNNSSSTGTSGTGWSKFPSGVIMKWGTATITATTSIRQVLFPVSSTIPVFTATPGYIKITPTSTGASMFNNVYVAQSSSTGFYAGGSLGTTFTINWFAIGI